jgi:hypothetical protein
MLPRTEWSGSAGPYPGRRARSLAGTRSRRLSYRSSRSGRPMALLLPSSWTLARPSVEMVTTSPELEPTLRTVFDRLSSDPCQPGSAVASAGNWKTWASAGRPKPYAIQGFPQPSSRRYDSAQLFRTSGSSPWSTAINASEACGELTAACHAGNISCHRFRPR